MIQTRLLLFVFSLFLLLLPTAHAQDLDTKFYYRLTNGFRSDKSLDAFSEGKASDKPILAKTSDEASQLWRIKDLGNGFFRVTNCLRYLISLDVLNDGLANNQLSLNETEDVSGQEWKIEGIGSDYQRLSNRWQEGKYLEVIQNGGDDTLILGKPENATRQFWKLEKTDIKVVEILKVSSKAFKEGAKIPLKYTGEGENVSPPLAWKGAPAGTKSFVVICEDPDAPSPAMPSPEGPFVHWILYNIPSNVNDLPVGLLPGGTMPVPPGSSQGLNSFDQSGYDGPLPPKGSGTHRYFFSVYALDEILDLAPGVTKKEALTEAMEGHVLAMGELMGTYEVKGSTNKLPESPATIATPFRDILNEVLRLTNIERANQGVPPLKLDPRLESAATAHSEEMARLGYFSHDSPTPGRETVKKRIDLSGFVPRAWAENIASFTSYPRGTLAKEAVKNWMDSPGHRRNILNPEYTHIGIGISLKGEQYYLTQKFALPGSALAQARLKGTNKIPALLSLASLVVTPKGRPASGKPAFTPLPTRKVVAKGAQSLKPITSKSARS